ncbi:cyclopropane-fatty-acyl-phospholipid synthase [Actinocorallia herbida]|uniref:Cyclopropane-fatty-acyl-phospholipid synthase n=1 Tax=Actinocorallia herbida TaxID=58109 RepID=A0A3N1DCG0_9ACTN|nr:cyclopropane-fatty-acyl-phospholipid synthase family protein [Actinocorallia herbida]ROO90818.1 cyclopropane-fatty-acyl-phospholipid synthase [Actinocorallia herbida]
MTLSESVSKPAYMGASAPAIEHHYDLGNAFFELWLDESRTYSCALWDGDDDTLFAAQQRKLDYMATGARATGAARVLDIGCGWGGMLRHLVERQNVARVVGLTLSPSQAESIGRWADDRYDVRVQNWADHEAEGYDAIISLGAFEHFAQHGMSREKRLMAYRTFFGRCRDWLQPGGRLALQTNIAGRARPLDRQTVREMLFVIEKIFPESVMPPMSDIIEASENTFDVVTVRNDPDHYVRTCLTWADTLRERKEEAESVVGAEVVSDYLHYLESSARQFERRSLGLARIIFERV